MNVVQIETLTGFEGGNVASSQWRKLDVNNLRTGLMLCRIQNYTDQSKYIPDLKLDFPIFHEYFILNYDGSLPAGAPPAASAVRQTTVQRVPSTISSNFNDNLNTINGMASNVGIYSTISHIKDYKKLRQRGQPSSGTRPGAGTRPSRPTPGTRPGAGMRPSRPTPGTRPGAGPRPPRGGGSY